MSFWVFVYEKDTLAGTLLPAQSGVLALRLALMKGVPASSLCSNPGTPFLDPPVLHQWVQGGGQALRVGWKRAGSRVRGDSNRADRADRYPERQGTDAVQ